MAIIRTVPLKDATSTAMTSCGVGTAYDVGGMFSGQKLYGGLHILSSSTGALVVRIQGSSSSVHQPDIARRAVGNSADDRIGGDYVQEVLAC